jgi:hypothetical protein
VPGGGSQACDPNSQSSRPLVFTSLFIYLLFSFPKFSTRWTGEIIHKRNEPNLATGQPTK